MRTGMPAQEKIRFSLINPPLTDPTAPYHSISYLVAGARQAGFQDFLVVDANIDALNHVFSREYFDYMVSTFGECMQNPPNTNMQKLKNNLIELADNMTYQRIEHALHVLRCQNCFYEIEKYDSALKTVYEWLDIITLSGLPFAFSGFSVENSPYIDLSSTDDLSNIDLLKALNAPFEKYYTDLISKLVAFSPSFIGISLAYQRQTPFAAWLCRLLKEHVPDAVLCVGGTEATDIVKGANCTSDVWKILDCDMLFVGEADTAFPSILEKLLNGQALEDVTGTIIRTKIQSKPYSLTTKFDNVGDLPSPSYDIWEWKNYWAPEPLVLYSPTRGCYWNRCTFCDYGLNSTMPTSPSRERPIEKVIADIHQIKSITPNIYLAVDAISPSFLRRFCQSLAEVGQIYWAAECRIEKSIVTRDLAERLAKAGCVAISFGLESGNPRILSVIDKGVDILIVPELLKALYECNVGVQLMTFYGMPSETHQEALDTLQFLETQRKHWQLVGFGKFELTPGAIIAKKPEKFGIKIQPIASGRLKRVLDWSHLDTEERYSSNMSYAIFDWITDSQLWCRPFLGGIDSTHTFLYFKKYGIDLIKNAKRAQSASQSDSLRLGNLRNLREYVVREQVDSAWSCAQKWLDMPYPKVDGLGPLESSSPTS